ncbi:MAG: B12-binding domain-containing radical SAM protein, partial [Candidatus Thorarchaeota archaeon]
STGFSHRGGPNVKVLFLVANTRIHAEPTIGVAYIAAYVRSYIPDVTIKILQYLPEDLTVITEFSPDIIGISSIVIQYDTAIKFAKYLKKETNVPIIIGGPHITLAPRSLHRVFDLGVVGEGEQTMLELLYVFSKRGRFDREELSRIKGLVFFHDGKLVRTKAREFIKPLDGIPKPARGLLDMEFHLQDKYVFGKSYGRGTYILTSRGCPFRCLFCSASKLWKEVRYNSPERVVEEIRDLIDFYDVELVRIYDSIFPADRGRLGRIATLMEREGIHRKVQMCVFCRVDLIDEEVCGLLKRMGVVFIDFGFESGSQRILDFLNKKTSLQQAEHAVAVCKKHGFKVGGTFMIGSPTETEDEMLTTLAFLRKLELDKFDFYTVVPYPGTALYDYCVEHGLVRHPMNFESFKQRNLDPSPIDIEDIINNKQILLTKAVTAAKYVEIHDKFRREKKRLYHYDWTKQFPSDHMKQ